MKTTHQFVMTDEYIAKAQHVTIAQNKALKFLYQTPWARWLPRAVIVAMMIFLYLINLCIHCSGAVGRHLAILVRRGVVRSMEFGQKRARESALEAVPSPLRWMIKGIDIEGANGNSQLKWSAMLQPAIYL